MWLLGRYDKRGQDCAYHIIAAREQCLEEHSDLDATDARRCETFCALSAVRSSESISRFKLRKKIRRASDGGDEPL